MYIPFGSAGICEVEKVTPTEMNEILNKWENYGRTEKVLLGNKCPTPGIKQYFEAYYRNNNASIFYGLCDGYPKCFIVGNGTTNSTNAEEAWKTFQHTIFSLGYPSLSSMFGTIDKKFWGFFTRCVPSYLNWFNPSKKGSYIECAQKTDVSSAFGYELSKPLPTLRGAVTCLTHELPSREYPFAFYKDGTLAIWNEFDSSKWDENVYSFSYCREQREKRCYEYSYPKNDTEPETILCKASSLNLKSIVEDLYEKKNTATNSAFYKAVINLSIGMMWNCKRPSYAHLAAVVIARCVDRMLKAYHTIIENDGTPILIATDSIAWEGNPLALPYTTTKYLGAMVLEHEDCELWGMGAKAYQLRDLNGTVTTKWSGVPKEKTEHMDFGDMPQDAIDYSLYCYSTKSRRFIVMEGEDGSDN